MTQQLARKIRAKGVYCEIIPAATKWEEIKEQKPQALVISGGPGTVPPEVISLLDPILFQLSIPVLAMGYGMLPMVNFNEGKAVTVSSETRGESSAASRIYTGEEEFFHVDVFINSDWMAPLRIQELPKYFRFTSRTEEDEPVSLISDDGNQMAFGFWPPEKLLDLLLDHFLYRQAGLTSNWTPSSMIESTMQEINQLVGENEAAICGLSGGIDSTVSALLVQKALGDRLIGIFVDHGLHREGEASEVEEAFRKEFGLNLIQVDASEEFLSLLEGVSDPEEKRRVIGNHFINVFEREARKLNNVNYLVQGTIYPDVIESTTPSGHTIKSHHNVGGLPDKMNLKLIEPVRALFKDEVRKVGEALGLPENLLWRHPFPGPGLAVRVLGEISRERLEIARRANAILEEEIREEGLYRDIWQVFAVVPEMRSVGVSGDRRTYAYPVILRAVNSTDAMTADWYRFSHGFLDRISHRMVEEIPMVNRVVYDVTSKPPATIEWE